MSRNVLIIHHVESMWDEPLKRITNKNSIQIGAEIARAIKSRRKSFDLIILTQFENWEPEDEHFESGLAPLVNEWHEYGYGWDMGDEFEDNDEFVEGGSHSRHVYVADWIKSLKNDSVTLCGAFDGECIEDMEIALDAVGIKPKRWEKFIVKP